MPSQEHTSASAEQAHNLFLPLLLLAIVVVALTGSQTSQVIRDRQQLLNARTNQEQSMTESRNVRVQLETIVNGIDQLASAGNQNAINVQARLSDLGVRLTGDGDG